MAKTKTKGSSTTSKKAGGERGSRKATPAASPAAGSVAPGVDIGIADRDRKTISQDLAQFLSDSFTLYLKTHNFHWNVTGPMFNSLHAMFMDQYTEQWNALDETAERIRARLAELRSREVDVELHYSLPDPWEQRLFVALCRRYNLTPFRDAGRRSSTVQVYAPAAFQKKTLWPEFLAFADELHSHLDELTTRVIREAVNDDVSEPVPDGVKALPVPNR